MCERNCAPTNCAGRRIAPPKSSPCRTRTHGSERPPRIGSSLRTSRAASGGTSASNSPLPERARAAPPPAAAFTSSRSARRVIVRCWPPISPTLKTATAISRCTCASNRGGRKLGCGLLSSVDDALAYTCESAATSCRSEARRDGRRSAAWRAPRWSMRGREGRARRSREQQEEARRAPHRRSGSGALQPRTPRTRRAPSSDARRLCSAPSHPLTHA